MTSIAQQSHMPALGPHHRELINLLLLGKQAAP